ncbi:MAG: 5-formyltetrahydrofolate cyclo-ligase, partial [Tenericutes bacterium]|nr:5-formyltetrahydrofolate cyclo-ligase [Mycoplasmatota bacterium]
TLKLIKFFLQNKRVAVPKIENNNMNFYYIKSLEELKSGYFGILEPVSNNLVTDFSNCVCITPGICFDLNGNRIGYGKGFYDKFFNEVDIYKIGLCYKKCLVRKIGVNNFDKRVEKVITD